MLRLLVIISFFLVVGCGEQADSDRVSTSSGDDTSSETDETIYPDDAASTMEIVESDSGSFYIDRYEASLVGQAAISIQNYKPKTSLNYQEAKDACIEGGKRLCTLTEWRLACKGPNSNTYGVSSTSDGLDDKCHLGNVDDADPSTRATGSFEDCYTEGTTIFDMVGNASEWAFNESQNDPTAAGGNSGTTEDEATCDVQITLDNVSTVPASTETKYIGFRCCVDESAIGDVPSPASLAESLSQ